MPEFFCPECFAKVANDIRICPQCGADMQLAMAASDYFEKLIHALGHPVDQTRMGAIIALGGKRDDRAASSLVDCAFAWPFDVLQGIEIIRSLRQLPWTDKTRSALKRLRDAHPAGPLRRAASAAIHAFETTGLSAPKRELDLAAYMDE